MMCVLWFSRLPVAAVRRMDWCNQRCFKWWRMLACNWADDWPTTRILCRGGTGGSGSRQQVGSFQAACAGSSAEPLLQWEECQVASSSS